MREKNKKDDGQSVVDTSSSPELEQRRDDAASPPVSFIAEIVPRSTRQLRDRPVAKPAETRVRGPKKEIMLSQDAAKRIPVVPPPRRQFWLGAGLVFAAEVGALAVISTFEQPYATIGAVAVALATLGVAYKLIRSR